MEYPERLLPQPNFKKIELTDLLYPLYLIRHTSTKDLFLSDTNNVLNPDKLEIQSDHLRDLSTNLFGRFLCEDIEIQLQKESENFASLNDIWDEGESVNVPIFNRDFVINKDRGVFYLNIGDVTLQDFEWSDFTNNTNYKLRFKILHTPTKCNFWHFSIRVFVNDLEVESLEISKNKKQKIWRQAKTFLIKCVSLQYPNNAIIIDETHYIKNVS